MREIFKGIGVVGSVTQVYLGYTITYVRIHNNYAYIFRSKEGKLFTEHCIDGLLPARSGENGAEEMLGVLQDRVVKIIDLINNKEK